MKSYRLFSHALILTALVTIVTPVLTLADETEEAITPPFVDYNGIRLSTHLVHAGDNILIYIPQTVSNSYLLKNGGFTIISPSGFELYPSIGPETDPDQHLQIKAYGTNKYAEAGVYKVVKFTAYYGANLSVIKKDLLPLNLSFEVFSNNQDTTPPTLHLNNIKLDDHHNDRASFELTVSDDKSGISIYNPLSLVIQTPDGNQIEINFSHNYTGEEIQAPVLHYNLRGEIIIPMGGGLSKYPELGPGIYKIRKLKGLKDLVGNQAADQDLSTLGLEIKVLTPEERLVIEETQKKQEIDQDKENNLNKILSGSTVQNLTENEKKDLKKNLEIMHDLITERVEKTKTQQDPQVLPKNLALQYCVQDLEGFLELHQAEITRNILRLKKEDKVGEIDIAQEMHQQLIDLQTLKYVLLWISETWNTYDNDAHPKKPGPHETELSQAIQVINESHCFKLPEFLDRYEKLVIEQTIKTKLLRDKLEKNPSFTGQSNPEIIEDARDVLVPLQSATSVFWKNFSNHNRGEKGVVAN